MGVDEGAAGEVTVRMSDVAGATGGPIFVAGRQHSGNTVLAVMLGRVGTCYSQIDENGFFEERVLFDRIRDPVERARRVFTSLKLEAEGVRGAVLEHMMRVAGERGGVTALELYLAGMDEATRLLGKRFWAQKATSYIFYGREILESVPGSRLIYMLRNPYDIAASKKRRGITHEFVYGTMLGWNKGLRISRALEGAYPGRFRVVKYEDLTREPERTVRGLFEFLGIEFEAGVLDVPHVNRAETRYSLTGDGKGLNRSRVYYYREHLRPCEIAALDGLALAGGMRGELEARYPDLPHVMWSWPMGVRVRAAAKLAVLPFRFAWTYVTRLKRSPAHLVVRTVRRLSG